MGAELSRMRPGRAVWGEPLSVGSVAAGTQALGRHASLPSSCVRVSGCALIESSFERPLSSARQNRFQCCVTRTGGIMV